MGEKTYTRIYINIYIHSAIIYIMYTYLGEEIKTTTNNRK